MQAYAEGFDVFDKCEYELDNAKIAHLWGQGSVVRSWLCELAARAFEADGNDLGRDRGLHRGLRRGPLDDRGRDRPRRADARDHRLAVRALALARQRRLRRPGAGGAAQPVRRPRRQERAGRTAQGRAAPRRASRKRRALSVAAQRGRPTAEPSPRTRSPRASSACRSRRRRSSSSARPATSPAQTAARALQPRPRGRAARALPPGRRLAQRKGARGLPRGVRGSDPPVLAAHARRGRARRRCSRTSATSPARSTTTSVYERARQGARRLRGARRRTAEPRLLPVDGARRSSR